MWKKISQQFVGLLITGLFLVVGWCSSAVAAEESYPTGLYLGGDLILNIPEGDLRDDFAEVEPGAGLNLKIGYNFPIHLAVEVEFGFSGHEVEDEDAAIGFLVIDLRYFPFSFPDRPLFPYFRVGIGGYALVIEDFPNGSGQRDDFELTGKGFDIGVGFDYYINSNASFGIGLTQRFVTYDEIEFLNTTLAEDVKGPMTSLHAGLKYHF